MGSHSGLVHHLGKVAYLKGYREFESLPHRLGQNLTVHLRLKKINYEKYKIYEYYDIYTIFRNNSY